MCLSNVYLNEKKQERLLIEEASQIVADSKGIQVNTLLAESKRLEDYYISEVNLMENYVLLKKRKE